MLKTHFLTLFLFLMTLSILTLILYALSCILFSAGVDDELQLIGDEGLPCIYDPEVSIPCHSYDKNKNM